MVSFSPTSDDMNAVTRVRINGSAIDKIVCCPKTANLRVEVMFSTNGGATLITNGKLETVKILRMHILNWDYRAT